MREGVRNILRAKFFNEWRAAKQEQLSRGTGASEAKIDEREAEEDLEALIRRTYEATLEAIKQEEEERARQEAAAAAAAAGQKAVDGEAES
jgi:hypothetical protein